MNIGDHELHGFSFSWFLFVLWVRFSSSFSFFSPFWAVFVVFFAQEHGPVHEQNHEQGFGQEILDHMTSPLTT